MSEVNDRPVSAWRIEQAMSAWYSARSRFLHDDPSLEHDEAAISELLGEAEGDIRTILTRVCRAAVHAQSMAEAAAKREKEITGRKKRYATRNENLRGLAWSILEALEERVMELPDLTVGLAAGRESVRITNNALVPDIYVETKTERIPDKAVLLSVLRTGANVPGAELSKGLDSLFIRKN
jgi:Siphovirus Gp157